MDRGGDKVLSFSGISPLNRMLRVGLLRYERLSTVCFLCGYIGITFGLVNSLVETQIRTFILNGN